MKLRTALLATILAASTITPAMAQQYGYDAQCRPLPPPGWMLMPQPPSQVCLQQRAVAAKVAAEHQRQVAAAEAAQAEAARQRQAEADARAASAQPATSSTGTRQPTGQSIPDDRDRLV